MAKAQALRSGSRYVGRYGGALRYWAFRNPMVRGAWMLTTGTLTDPLGRHVVVCRGTADDVRAMLAELGAEPDGTR